MVRLTTRRFLHAEKENEMLIIHWLPHKGLAITQQSFGESKNQAIDTVFPIMIPAGSGKPISKERLSPF
jgi:hypothetical protein